MLVAEPIINRGNVGRIAERIVANELEYRGYRVSDLNKEGIAANADLLASRDGKTWQIQVKGSSFDDDWWFNYGHCTEEVIGGAKPVFNRHDAFYLADTVVMICVQSPSSYRALVAPLHIAEKAAQLNLEHSFRTLKADGTKKKPGKMWTWVGRSYKTKNLARVPLIDEEQALLKPHLDAWTLG